MQIEAFAVLSGSITIMIRIALVALDTLRKDAFDAEFDWFPGKRFDPYRLDER
ncbi:hypothetical protein SAMN05421858_3201 [Haladaptatus litoreus]|uniref:Uncharacterized protein n=1 Tax=Haladaptatus litoreus TaxID=553468 RepID=A0A1N7CRR0_9EURY|nr:hypothetical protein SAMN05421858_3201 [Haladaptatus litoreus]